MSFQKGDRPHVQGTFRDLDGNLTDPTSLTFTLHAPDGTETTYTYGLADDFLRHSTGVFSYEFTTTASGRWAWSWAPSGNIIAVEPGSIWVDESDLATAPPPRFASVSDLAAMPGVTISDDAQAELLLDLATSAITAATGQTTAWALALNPIPGMLRLVCLTIARRLMLNQGGVRSRQEQLGAYSYSETYATGQDTGPLLSDIEERLCRDAVFGSNAGSFRPRSVVDDLIELRETDAIEGAA